MFAAAPVSPAPPRPVPILEYHVVADPPSTAPYPVLYVRPPDFERQVRWLVRHRYTAVTLDRVYAAWQGRARLPRKPVVLTFDDGYRSQMVEANRILRRYHWPGNLNLLVAQTEHRGGLEQWRVQRLIGYGWEVDAHTFTHRDLTTLGASALRWEVAGSRRWLRQHFHVGVDFFCYPAGRYDSRVVDAVRAAGYVGAETENPGFATAQDDPFTLPRIRVNLGETIASFAHALGSRA